VIYTSIYTIACVVKRASERESFIGGRRLVTHYKLLLLIERNRIGVASCHNQPPACPVATFYDFSTTCLSSHNVATTPSFCHRLESRFIKIQNKTGRNSKNSARSCHFLLVYLPRLEIEPRRTGTTHPSTINIERKYSASDVSLLLTSFCP